MTTRETRTALTARPVHSTVDIDALVDNFRHVTRLLRPTVGIGVALKANAYGHGAVEVALRLAPEGVRFFMTESLEAVAAIRAAGVDSRLVMVGGFLPDAVGDVIRSGAVPTVYSLETAARVSESVRGQTPVYIKVDAGLGRLGIELDEVESVVPRIARLPKIVIEGIYTHLPFATGPGEAWSRQQTTRFALAVKALAEMGIEIRDVQAASSSGVLAGIDDDALTCVCLGGALYGLTTPTIASLRTDWMRRAFASLSTRLIQVSPHSLQRRAGSGGARVYEAGSVTGVVPVGMADGYRPALNGAENAMLVQGRRAPVIGVSLAHTTLDLTSIPGAAVGDEVMVIGAAEQEEVTLEELGGCWGVSAAEVVLSFDRRVRVEYAHLSGQTRVPDLLPNAVGAGY